VDNPQQLNKEEFNKAAYLDLSKPYTGNTPQPVSEKYNQATTLLKEVAGTVRNALGSTNSDNVDQLGNKITTGISNQISYPYLLYNWHQSRWWIAGFRCHGCCLGGW
jgi:hypothetical protein